LLPVYNALTIRRYFRITEMAWFRENFCLDNIGRYRLFIRLADSCSIIPSLGR